jgi:hypothetical protein
MNTSCFLSCKWLLFLQLYYNYAKYAVPLLNLLKYTVKPDITKETVQTLFFVISRDSLYPGYIVYLIMVIYIVNSVISLLRHIIQVCSIFTNSNSPSVANCFAFRFTIWYVSVMLSRTAFQPKDPSPLNIRIFTLTTTFDLPANDVSSTLSHCSFFANISLTVDSPQWKSQQDLY